MVKKRTEEKRQALGPLTLTVTLEDFMQDFHDALSPRPEDCMEQPETITDRDSGVLDPPDYSVCDESSLSSCDMWDDGKGFLNNLLDDLPSASDDSLYEVLRDVGPWSPQEFDFDLEDLLPPDEGEQVMDDVEDFDVEALLPPEDLVHDMSPDEGLDLMYDLVC